MPGKWITKETVLHSDCKIFKINRSRRQSETSGYEQDFFVLDGNNWVNIIPITSDNKIIMVRQFRHGVEKEMLEIPGGAFNKGETAIEAGLRELREETGYTSSEVSLIGVSYPNPAIQSNEYNIVLALNCEKKYEQELDPAEEIEVEFIPIEKISEMIANGEIKHSLVIVAFYYYDLHLKTKK